MKLVLALAAFVLALYVLRPLRSSSSSASGSSDGGGGGGDDDCDCSRGEFCA